MARAHQISLSSKERLGHFIQTIAPSTEDTLEQEDPNVKAFLESSISGVFEDLDPGTFVAFSGGQLLGTGEDREELITRLTSQGISADMLVQPVNVPIETVHIRGPRIRRDQG